MFAALMRFIFYILFLFILVQSACAQDDAERSNKLGFIVGTASQRNFPGASRDYEYETTSYRIQYERLLGERDKWDFSLIVEPGIFTVDHRLLNEFFIKPSTPDFPQARERFQQPRRFTEYALNVGLKAAYGVTAHWDIYAMGSTGPMYGSQTTERLKRGLSFSNIFGIGTQYQIFNQLQIDLRCSVRHTSNAGTRKPNTGHNSLLLETGVSYGF